MQSPSPTRARWPTRTRMPRRRAWASPTGCWCPTRSRTGGPSGWPRTGGRCGWRPPRPTPAAPVAEPDGLPVAEADPVADAEQDTVPVSVRLLVAVFVVVPAEVRVRVAVGVPAVELLVRVAVGDTDGGGLGWGCWRTRMLTTSPCQTPSLSGKPGGGSLAGRAAGCGRARGLQVGLPEPEAEADPRGVFDFVGLPVEVTVGAAEGLRVEVPEGIGALAGQRGGAACCSGRRGERGPPRGALGGRSGGRCGRRGREAAGSAARARAEARVGERPSRGTCARRRRGPRG
jgi:hypothetical protein